MIKEEGYPYQKYEITTEDNYIINVHRIPSNSSGKVVLLMHGLFSSSAVYLFFGPKYSLGSII